MTSDRHLPPSLANWLTTPTAYPAERPSAVRRVETHISCVFLTDRFAYKLKKPVRFDFLDFSTAQLRRRACEEEIRLNRRLAPHVYLGLVAVRCDDSGQWRLDESAIAGQSPPSTDPGEALDWLVKMQRLPDDATLLAKIQARQTTDADAVARRLAKFYHTAPPLPVEPAAYRAEIQRHVRANRTELLRAEHGLNATSAKRIHGAQLRLLLLQPELFDARVQAGRIVDGHGDLRPEHIYLLRNNRAASGGNAAEVEPAIIDCIEFNPEFRHLDVADELSFLATECDFAGAEPLGRRIFEQTLAALGDRPPPELVAFYRSYRACVRAKVAVLRGRQQTGHNRNQSRAEAQRHLQWADRYDRHLPPPLVLVMSGLMGSGKSTLAAELADLLGAEILATDAIRLQMLGKSAQPADYGSGNYTAEDRRRVYAEMFRRAGQQLDGGLSVVLDGAFPYARLRTAALDLARRRNFRGLLVHCHCPDDVARQRITARWLSGEGISEARPELYDRHREEEEPNPPEIEFVEIDTTRTLDEQVETVLAAT